MRSLRLLSEAVTCLELFYRLVIDPPLNPRVPACIQGATVMSGLVTFLIRSQHSLWGSEFILLSCFLIVTRVIFFLPRVVYPIQLFLKNCPLFRNTHSFKLGSGSRNHPSRKPSMMPHLQLGTLLRAPLTRAMCSYCTVAHGRCSTNV